MRPRSAIVRLISFGLAGFIGADADAALSQALIVPPGGFILGRSVFNMAVGAMQIAGFGVGGLLIALVSPRTALVLGALLCLGTALIARLLPQQADRFICEVIPNESGKDVFELESRVRSAVSALTQSRD